MAIVSEAKVQQWLEPTKLTIDYVADYLELVTTAKNMAFGMVASAYDTASWLDESSTPALIKDAVSMFVAAWIYARAYSEDATDANSYSLWLEKRANDLLKGIGSGGIDLPEIDGNASTSIPLFWPNNSSINEFDEPERSRFTMGSRF